MDAFFVAAFELETFDPFEFDNIIGDEADEV